MAAEREAAAEVAAALGGMDLAAPAPAAAESPASRPEEAPGSEAGPAPSSEDDASGGASPNGSAPQDKPASSQRVVAKFLMSNAAAGSIIGKAGVNITELQNQSSARLQLSRTNEFFPGTEDRVLICSGTINQVLTALHLVLTRIQNELSNDHEEADLESQRTSLRLLLPSALCGVLIGKGGATIRSFAQDSGASITVSAQNAQLPGVSDRVVRLMGSQAQLMRALALILSKLLESPHYARLAAVPVNYTGPSQLGWAQFAPQMLPLAQLSARGPPPGHAPAALGGLAGPPVGPGGGGLGPAAEVMIPVPDARIGAVIGKGGEIINQLKALVGVKIRISDRDDFVPGTRDRKVHVSGSPEAVSIASALIQQKAAAASGPPRAP